MSADDSKYPTRKQNLIRDHVCRLIDGGLRVGDLLPSVSKLSIQLDVSRMTVIRALRQMEAEGIVVCREGRGIFVGDYELFTPRKKTKGAKGRSNRRIITFLSPEIHTSPFMKKITDGVEAAFTDDEFEVVRRHYYAGRSHEEKVLSEAVEVSEGIIMIPSYPPALRYQLQNLADIRYPLVFLDRWVDSIMCSYVGMDNAEAVFALMDELHEHGHREIGFYCPSPVTFAFASVQERYEAYQSYMRKMKSIPFLFQSQAALIAHIERKYMNSLTALVASNDIAAYQLYDALKSLGIAVPDELSIAGIDDLSPHNPDDCKITSIRQPQFSMGHQAGRLIRELITRKQTAVTKILLKGELVRGQSVAYIHPQVGQK